MSFKILATADLHLGRHSSRLPDRHVGEFGPTTRVLEDIKKQALDLKVDAVIIAGDVIDDHNDFLEIYDALSTFFQTLLEHEIHVVVTAGNHDFNSLPEFINHWQQPETSQKLHLLGSQSAWKDVTLTNNNGETVQFIGWSFESRYYHNNPIDLLDHNQIASDTPTVGLLHGDLKQKESSYAPVDHDQIKQYDVAAWIVGHIHKPDILNQDQPFIAYPGSPQPLSPKETKEHRLLFLEIEPSSHINCQHIPLKTLRYHDYPISITEDLEPEALRSHIHQKLGEVQSAQLNIVDLELTGIYPDLDLIDEIAGEFYDKFFQNSVFIQKVSNRVKPAIEQLSAIAEEQNPPGIIAQALIDLQENQPNSFLRDLRKQIQNCRQRIDQSTAFNPLNGITLEEHQTNNAAEESSEIDYLIEQTLWEMLYTLRQQKEEVNLG